MNGVVFLISIAAVCVCLPGELLKFLFIPRIWVKIYQTNHLRKFVLNEKYIFQQSVPKSHSKVFY